MRAIVQRAYGAPHEVLELREIDTPVPGAHEVLVRVRAASVHPDVWHVVRGWPYPLRLMGAGLLRPKNQVPGTDLAGEVESVGSGVRRFRLGDEVFGECVRGHQWHNGGAFAEYVAVSQTALAMKPANLTFEEAAAVPTSGLLALRNVRDEGQVRPGQNVLVNGAGGGVGIFALQIAKAYGATVTGVDSSEKLDMLRSLGAHHVIAYQRADFTEGEERYDLIVDIPGNHSFAECKRVLTPAGKYVLVGHDRFGAAGSRWLGSFGRMLGLVVRSPFTSQLPGLSPPTTTREPLLVLKELAEAGQLRPIVDRTFPLAEVSEAMQNLADGHVRGKVVITV